MAVVLDATPSGAAANSYVTLAEADAYFATRSHSDVWTTEADDDVRSRALITACNHLEAYLEWMGYSTTSTQRLSVPRSGLMTRNGATEYPSTTIPEPIKQAQCEQALVELVADRTTETSNGALKRVQADVLEVEYFEGHTYATGTRVLSALVWDMVAPWIYNGEPGPSQLRVVDVVRV